jgi:YD repeat-containing protein
VSHQVSLVRRGLAAMTMIVCVASIGIVHANSDEATPEEQFHRRIKMSDDIVPLGESAFGESVDLYTGELSFRQVDITLKGTGPDIVIARTFSPGWRTSLDFPEDGAFADWQLDVPRLSSLVGAEASGAYAGFGAQWQANGQNPDLRCANMTHAPQLPGTNGPLFDSLDWWHGYSLVTAEGGGQSVLSIGANTAVPAMADANGQAIPFVAMTPAHWMIGCEGAPASGEPGDAFIAISPSGLRYHLNWLNYYSSPTASLPNPPSGKHITARIASADAVATKVEDRFGNYIQYHYQGRRLTSIDASDGRLVTFTWRPETDWVDHITLTDASGATRTWSYQYADESQLISGTSEYLGRLSAVTLPDGSSWEFGLQGLLRATVGQNVGIAPSCAHGYFQVTGQQNPPFTGTMQAPSGLSGSFTVTPTQRIREGDSRPPTTCSPTEVPFFQPASYFNIALTQKHYTGAGVDSIWSYAYGNPTLYWADECTATGCPAHTAWTDVTQPDNTVVRSEFDNTFNGPLEGKLIATRTGLNVQTGTAARVESNSYADVATPGLGNPLGFALDPLGNTNRLNNQQPLSLRQVTQDGNVFTWSAGAFDAFGNPGAISRHSDVAGQSTLNEAHTYLNDTSHWVLALPLSTVNSDTSEIIRRNTYDPARSVLSARYAFEHLLMTYGFDAQGRLATFTDGDNHTTTLSDYKLDVPRAVAFPDQTSEQFTVDDFGDVTSATDAMGATTQYRYDALGRLAEVNYPAGDTVAWSAKRYSFAFSSQAERGLGAGHWVRTIVEGPKTTTTLFDVLWRPVLSTISDTTTGVAISTRTDYDWAGRAQFTSYPGDGAPDLGGLGAGVTTTYDVLGRPTLKAASSELGTLNTSTAYLSGASVQITDPRNKITTTAYQVFDEPDVRRPVAVATGGVLQTISRDVYGNVRSIAQGTAAAVQLTRTWVYDAFYRVCRVHDPESGDRVIAYDGADNIAWTAAGQPAAATCSYDEVPAAVQTARSYDAMNRVTSIVYPAGTDPATFTYDATGREATATSGLVTWAFGYNKRGLPTAEHLSVDGFNFPLDYAYTPEGVMASTSYPDGKVVASSPDGLGRPTAAGAYATGGQYFADGKLKAFTLGSQVAYTAAESPRQFLSELKYGTAAGNVIDETLTYDESGNLLGRKDHTQGDQRTASFGYDDLNRLTTAIDDGLWGTESYDYDSVNNLTAVHNSDGDANYIYDSANRLTSIMRGGAAIHTLSYDDRGNAARRDGQQLIFDQADRLLTIQNQDGYLYDASGRRVRSQDVQGGARKYWAYNSDGKLLFSYDPSSTQGTDYIYLGDHLVASTQNSLSKVVGNVDGVVNSTIPTADLVGWACSTGLAQSIQVEAFVNGGPGVGTSVGSFSANTASEQAVAQACQVESGSYRFDIPLTDAFRIAHAGQSLYVVGKSPNGGTDVVLSGSGGVVVPPSVEAPAAPASILASAAANLTSIQVSWSAVANETSYALQMQFNGGAWQAVTGVSGTNATVAQPADGTYAFRIQACNTNGCSAFVTSAAVAIRHIPAAPTAISVPGSSTGSIPVSWSASTYATSYELQENVNGGGWSVAYSGAATSATIGVGASSSVAFQVRACNSNGCSGFTAGGPVAVTVAPSAAPALSGGGTSTNGSYGMSWTSVAGASSYTLFESANGGGAQVVQASAATSWSVAGKGNGTYVYQVQACNGAGCGPLSAAASVSVTLIPATPSPRLDVDPGPKVTKYTVTWAAVNGATRYEAIRSDTHALVYSGTALSFSLGSTSASSPIAYTALVRACNEVGCSAYGTAN